MEYEVLTLDNGMLLKLQNVINVMKTTVATTGNETETVIFTQPYSRGKNVGMHFYNSSGRSVLLYCHHSDYGLYGLFGHIDKLNTDEVKEYLTEFSFNNDFQKAAESIFNWLLYEKL